MAAKYAQQFNRRTTPQSDPVPGSTQVPNSAGGFAWQITPWQKFDRFLILGAEGGTYYVAEKTLINQSHDAVLACFKEDGVKAVARIVEVSDKGLAFKNDPAIFCLALAVTHGNDVTKQAAYGALPKVCRIGTHLFHFAEYVNAMRGWGRGLRRAVADWYVLMAPEKLALQVVKYQSRDGWSHRDLLRLAHPVPTAAQQKALFRWVVGGADSLTEVRTVKRKQGTETVDKVYDAAPKNQLPSLINAFERAKKADVKRLVELILEHDLPRECVPTEMLGKPEVWDALLHKMPLTAMIRNLGKMTSLGLVAPLSDAARKVTAALTSEGLLQKARIHPLSVLIALKQYSLGHGDKGRLSWSPVQTVVDALDQAFYLSFGNVRPIGKPVLLGLDVSGSMSILISGTNLSCAEAAAALSLVTANVESDYLIMGFDQGIRELRVSPRMRLDTVLKNTSAINGGGTDCALPMIWAAQNKVKIGGFIVLTDSETWAGDIHPAQALRDYRNNFVPDAREVVVGMTADDFTIADPADRYALDVAGFDTNVPNVVSDFIRGDI